MIETYDLSTIEGVANRAAAFVEKVSELEEEKKEQKADSRWLGFDRLAEKLAERVKPADLVKAGFALLGDKDGYVVNAGLTLLGTPQAVSHIANNSRMFGQALKAYDRFIPFSWELNQIGERSPRSYNFLRSVEGLLKLREEVSEEEILFKYPVLAEEINLVITQRIRPEHQRWLGENSEAEDMQGTLIREYYGRHKNPKL